MDRSSFLGLVAGAAVAQSVPSLETPAPAAVAQRLPSRILVLGDSVTWGQGLRDPQKMHNLLAAQIFRATGRAPYVAFYAHSGAIIGATARPSTQAPWWPREIPSPHATVLEQIELVFAEELDPRFDLIIVDGGLNDVDVHYVFNPNTAPADVTKAATQHCGPDMVKLLGTIRDRFTIGGLLPQVFVLTYYPIVSSKSVFPSLLKAGAVLGWEAISPPNPPPANGLVASQTEHHLSVQQSIAAKLVANSMAFRTASLNAHTMAVATANAVDSGSHFVLIDPQISESESAFTSPMPLIWGLDKDIKPEDPVLPDRIVYCDLELKQYMHGILDAGICRRASVGHPNVAGASRYADVMFATLQAPGGGATPPPST
jgi:lysophospholipase L1-like esterase